MTSNRTVGNIAATTMVTLIFSLLPFSVQAADLVDAVRAASPSVVRITALRVVTDATGKTTTKAMGYGASGVVFTADGYIVSCATAVATGRPQHLLATFADGKSLRCRVISTDLKNDLILLKVAATGLKPITKAPTGLPSLGQWVFTIGNPFSLARTRTDSLSVNAGVVSAVKPLSRDGFLSKKPMIIVDITTNPGASGGALLDTKGRLLGICGRILRSSRTGAQLSFTVPVASAVTLLAKALPQRRSAEVKPPVTEKPTVVEKPAEQPDKKDAPKTGYLGASILDDAAGRKGAFIHSVVPDSPADKAGLKADDLVVALDSVAILNGSKLMTELDKHKPGVELEITVMRKGTRNRFRVTLGVGPRAVLK